MENTTPNKFDFAFDKSISALKLVLSNLKDSTGDFHKIFKIFYFADKKHIGLYGTPITGDRYIAMKDGPVPSTIYDILKYLRGNSLFTIQNSEELKAQFSVFARYYIKALDVKYDLDIFSESEIECLEESIGENKRLTFNQLVKKSHDLAWNAAEGDNAMSIFDIAKAAGANEAMLNYINQSMENSQMEIN